jgi:gluconate 2-dehydrogenase gamma chain
MLVDTSRRHFLAEGLAGVSAVWVSTHWPSLVAAAEHAHAQVKSSTPPKFEFFTSEDAAEVDAITSRVIPTTDTPGAYEAGVVFFIDHALVTFAKENQKVYRDGLLALQARVRELFPGTDKFSGATPEQQDKVLESLDEQSASKGRNPFRRPAGGQSFFERIRVDTIMGFLIDPDSDKKGNRDAVGWKVIGRDPAHMFQPPFGYYDKDYPGWQPNSSSTDKTKS